METVKCDVLIVGAGVAGLWTANALLKRGRNVLLLESSSIGGAQTIASQGILHSGVKYGIDGSNREIAQQLKSMPPRWISCLKGQGELDLSSVQVSSDGQYLWSKDRFLGSFTSAMAGRAMQGEVQEVSTSSWPELMRENPPAGSLYEVKEPILDIKSVLHALTSPLQHRMIHAEVESVTTSGEVLQRATVFNRGTGSRYLIEPRAIVFTSGAGNETAIRMMDWTTTFTQRRPLRMVMVKDLKSPFYGHCVTASPKPRVTITAHKTAQGWLWYLGGDVAEKGASLNDLETIALACKEMSSIFPSINWKDKRWACYLIDRAESKSSDGSLPGGPHVVTQGNALVAWPTKLVYAPLLSDRVCEWCDATLKFKSPLSADINAPLPRNHPPFDQPAIGSYPWELNVIWQTAP